MSFKHVIEMYDLMDSAYVTGDDLKRYFEQRGFRDVEMSTVHGQKGKTDFVKVLIKGKNGKSSGGTAPTLGVIGRLGGIGARPEQIGFVSDGDGALACMAAAAKLAEMQQRGDVLAGDILLTTHICPDAPTLPHDPVPFMNSPVDMQIMNANEVAAEMDAILSIDTTKGNMILNHTGYAITPTVKEGYILRISNDLLEVMKQTSGNMPVTLPITVQDITPYGNNLHHINSIMQPCVVTDSPVVGIALTTQVPVAGCATGATHLVHVEQVVRFVIEVAKLFGVGKCAFYDEAEFARLTSLYGSMKHLLTLDGKVSGS
ncbi:hypothetical protein BAG01nite_37880 [Brevibacillus agri]|uniref:DUF1177 domain-containing protein n=1 Tax=Brevibacillus agri TaxID=51101 RepID=A0A3M8ATR5_9BACL|nr:MULTISPECIES: DUF1177 domain-containing protein [Brevibacillus]ELK40964.1 hypothetical protein D478_16129 [Brevibacillus agri BAB-2500]EJL41989.1 Protein of unknown function (DUF1177) [Brevibacillus sp. CF112]MBY0050590.1 DUF1177 domain-containing protein [Brevibacillus agri]MDR9504248.1 DUF1177 domain-containing protein [Brevibacillus agri]MED1824280.1 DUF1177 domain-containing protein [Brevibacillus agri]